MREPFDILIVGAGAAATMLAAALRRAPGPEMTIGVVGRGHPAGRGVAYSTTDRQHLMNVPARRLSIDGDGSDHLANWLGGIDPNTYVPRTDYGRYLAAQLQQSDVEVIEARVDTLRPSAAGWRAEITGPDSTASAIEAREVILGVGWPPGPGPIPLPEHDRVISDPWSPELVERVAGCHVLVLGTGLTMVDVTLTATAAGATVEAISRNGLLPRRHRAERVAGVSPFVLPAGPLTAGQARRLVVDHVTSEPAGWEAGMDSARDHADAIWSRLPHDEQAKILRRGLSSWTVHRHRMAPGVATTLDTHLARGQVRVSRGAAFGVRAHADRVEVHGRRGRRWEADVVVCCTGPSRDIGRTTDPLLRQLFDEGLAEVGPHRLGVGVDVHGAVAGPRPGLWTIGPLRGGTLFETTAIPEIREQARLLAPRLVPTGRTLGV